MSYTELVFFDKKGDVVEIKEVKNAFLSAFTIWKRLYQKYYPNEDWVKELYSNMCKNVWKLYETHDLTKDELICLFYTYDYGLTNRENVKHLIDALKTYHIEDEDTLLEQAEIIEKAFENEKIEFIGTHQTTVSCSYWYDNNCIDEPEGWLIFDDKVLKEKILKEEQ